MVSFSATLILSGLHSFRVSFYVFKGDSSLAHSHACPDECCHQHLSLLTSLKLFSLSQRFLAITLFSDFFCRAMMVADLCISFYNVLIQPCSCCSMCWEHSSVLLLAFSGSAFSPCFPNELGLSVVGIILCSLWSCSHSTASKHENVSLWRVCVYFPDFFCSFITEQFKASPC